jgi:signal transduction histidine kinase
VRADNQQIKQVLINLIQNSADSIGRDGVITLRVSGQSGSARKASDGTVVMEVADTGKGIPPEVQKRLFDPFFTTKEGGTGLGLPIAARIVEKHGGKLLYQTAHNRGTTFRVVLPQTGKNET